MRAPEHTHLLRKPTEYQWRLFWGVVALGRQPQGVLISDPKTGVVINPRYQLEDSRGYARGYGPDITPNERGKIGCLVIGDIELDDIQVDRAVRITRFQAVMDDILETAPRNVGLVRLQDLGERRFTEACVAEGWMQIPNNPSNGQPDAFYRLPNANRTPIEPMSAGEVHQVLGAMAAEMAA